MLATRSSSRTLRPLLTSLLALVVLGGARVARAEEPGAPTMAEPGAAPIAGGTLSVEIDAEKAGLDAAALRDAIATEAGIQVTEVAAPGATRLLVHATAEHSLSFELVDPKGRRVERTIELPAGDPTKARDTAALVAASLLEDEAAALLAKLRAENVHELPPPPDSRPPRKKKLVEDRPSCVTPHDLVRPFGADFAPYLGSSSIEPAGTTRRFSLEFLGGHPGAVEGVELSPLVTISNRYVCGAQVAFAGGWISGPLRGVAVDGIAFRATDVEGGVLTGFGSFVGRVRGFQLAGFGAISGHVTGFQLGGFGAWNDGIDGAQVGGFAAVTVRTMRGFQAAPLAMADEIQGLQLGAVNIAGGVRGVQLGIVDVARTSDVSIGAVTIVVEGRTHVQAFATSEGLSSVALQHGSRYVHNFYGASVAVPSGKSPTGGPLLGIGVHVPAGRAYVDVDFISHVLFDPNGSGTVQSVHEARIVAGITVVRGVALFAGPTYQVLIAPNDETPDARTGALGVGSARSGSEGFWYWPGLTAGVSGL